MKEKRKQKKNGVLIDLCLPTGTKTQDRFLMCGTSDSLKRGTLDGTEKYWLSPILSIKKYSVILKNNQVCLLILKLVNINQKGFSQSIHCEAELSTENGIKQRHVKPM